MLRYLPFLLVLAVWIYAFIDCLNTPEQEVRKLPKVVWVIVILLFGQVLLGPVAWFIAGRPRRNAPYGATRPDERRWVAPDDNPEFLKSLDNGTDHGATTPPPAEPREAEALRREEPQEAEVQRHEDESGGDDGPEGTQPKG
jgi:hypothetical protein